MVTRGSRWPLMIDPQGQVSISASASVSGVYFMHGSSVSRMSMSNAYSSCSGVDK